MPAPTRRRFDMPMAGSPAPAEHHLSLEHLAAAAGISPARLARLVREGLVDPIAPGAFTVAAVARVRRMLRLHRDLGVSFTGAAIIVDLLERLERLEAELARRRGHP